MAMTQTMKRFLTWRGITATTIADRAGLAVQRDIYGMLWGFIEPAPELHDVLCGIYGMTEEEYADAFPERRKRNASSGTNHQNHSTAADAGRTGGENERA